MINVTLENSFHRTTAVVRMPAGTTPREAWNALRSEFDEAPKGHFGLVESARYRRVRRALCGVAGCACGGYRP